MTTTPGRDVFGILDEAMDLGAEVAPPDPGDRDPIETDPVAWVEHAAPKIEHKKYGQVVFRPFDYQKKIMRMRAAGQSFVCEKSRQTGVSTAIMIADTHALLYADACFAHIIAQKEEVAKDRLLEISKRALRTCVLTPEQKQKLSIRGFDIAYGNNNYLRCHTAAPNATRSFAGNRILLEEAAYMDYGEEVWKSVCPMLDDHEGQIAVVSTYNGDGDFFCGIVDRHEELGLELLSIDWRAHPERDEAWKARSIARFEGSEDEWREEHELYRLQRGEAVVDVGLVQRLGQEYQDACIEPREHPVQGHEYILGGDVGGGGRARSVNVAIDVTTEPPHLAVLEHEVNLSHPQRRAYVEDFRTRFPSGSVHWLDGGGPGAAIVEEMVSPPEIMIIVGGSANFGTGVNEATGMRYTRVPRELLLSQTARKLENGSFVVPPWHKRALMALKSARWGRKKDQNYSDELDGIMIAAWTLPEEGIASQRGTGPMKGVKPSSTLQAIMNRRW